MFAFYLAAPRPTEGLPRRTGWLLLALLACGRPVHAQAPAAGSSPASAAGSLIRAAAAGNAAGVQQALLAGANADVRRGDATALMLATHAGSLETVALLLDAGADCNGTGAIAAAEEAGMSYGSPVAIAAASGRTDLLERLLDACRFPVDQRDRHAGEDARSGWTALQWAASRGHVDAVEFLLGRGAHPDAREGARRTPLALALRRGRLDTALRLVAAGADVNVEVDQGLTPLHVATMARLTSFAVTLFEAGADVAASAPDGRTPIDAAFYGGEDALLKLFYCAATPAVVEARRAPLIERALELNDTAIAQFLRSPDCDGARIASEVRLATLRAPLLHAVSLGDSAGVHRLLAEGVRPNVRDDDGATAMLLAVTSGSVPILRLLAAHGADCSELARVQVSRPQGGELFGASVGRYIGGPLGLAAWQGRLPVVRFLIEECGVAVDEREWEVVDDDRTGFTALQRAAREGSVDVVEYLLERGADVEGGADVKGSEDGLSAPLILALDGGYVDVAARLLARGARVDHEFGPRLSALYHGPRRGETMFRLLYCAAPGPLRTAHAAELRQLARDAGHAFLLGFMSAPDCGQAGLDALTHAWTATRAAHASYQAGRFEDMEQHARAALEIRERILGPDHIEVAEALNDLAVARLYNGDYATALTLHERALALRRSVRGDDHVDVAISMNNLAFAYAAMGDHERALPLYQTSLELRQRLSRRGGLPAEYVGTALSNLADLHYVLGDYERSRTLQEQALATRRRGGDELDGHALESMIDLALVHSALGDHGRAREVALAALEQVSRIGNNIDVAYAMTNIATVFGRTGDAERAFELHQTALRIRRQVFGEPHLTVAESQRRAAEAAFALGDIDHAVSLALAAAAVLTHQTAAVLPALSVAEQQALLLRHAPPQTALLLSLLPGHPRFGDGYEHLLRWKGALLQGIRQQQSIARLTTDPSFGADAAALRDVRAELAAWFHRAGQMPLPEWQARNDSLSIVKERLERRLAGAAAPGFADAVADLGLAGLQRLLPEGEALIDIYRHEVVAAGTFKPEARYAAVVTSRSGGPHVVDLGAAAVIEDDVAAWHNGVAWRRDEETVWAALRQDLWLPIKAVLPPATRSLWVSPDAALARLPWHLFTESFRVSLIDSPRELAELLSSRVARTRHGGGPILVVGDIDFDTVEVRAGMRSVPDSVRLAPLPGTAAEMMALTDLARELGWSARTLSGATASGAAVRTLLPQARYAHLATHGFFYAGEDGAVRRRREVRLGEGTPYTVGGRRNPLLESGLALAGANLRDGLTGQPLGRLTAEELVGLDLRGALLVTLSACDSGRGHEVTGQGVMGLRSALVSAGARAVLMSLWKVDDDATALLMEAFYRGLWQEHLTPEAALRQAQAVVRDHPGGAFAAPGFWAAWVLAGEAW